MEGGKGGLVVGLWKQDGGLRAFFARFFFSPAFFLTSKISDVRHVGFPPSLANKTSGKGGKEGEKRLRSKRIPCLT